ncbi:SDR family oxidoreductase [Prosthecochloris sp. N3]|uniref:SDR family oxidoreductase n=1 Tax=Prosthecochloris ethylica TaxID=2743976 RepID=A0ABR9XU41_9CHLB|nr:MULTISPECIES: SDR family oxidoreductase [Prosthecochloris]MBF0586570.1 SDR family oxidoreductase [Prosthecochloris ethylica]MBF0637533.1 SDR family oxidoreductase [Prosthecochloris ethylica]NUK47682.1 SDR family oxidoreductase [Prosthecochloris ethylica]RNA64349.1 SDR family oxidoreductase [Prosthecochloris sp. ZM_2]
MTDNTRKVCFMTGASGRLGREIAVGLARKGFDMYFTWRSNRQAAEQTLDTIRTYSPASGMIECDISDTAQIRHAFRSFSERFDRLDLLVASASNFFATPLGSVTEEAWDSLVDTNLKGTFFTLQEAANLMSRQPFISRIITMTDISAGMIWKNFAPYTASKAAVQHLTRVFAKTYAPGILVNSIAPGTITINPQWNNAEELEEELTSRIPLKQLGGTEDIMGTVDFLVENNYITGQVINVDGGRTLT